MLYSCVAGGIVLWFKSFLRNRVDIWLDKVISPDFFSWGYCLCIRSGIWWLPLHFQPSVPLILLKTSDLYAVCAGSQMPYAVNFWSHEGRSYSWKWSRRKACSFVQWDKACCVFCFWCLKDVFFFPYCRVCRAESFELFTSEITFPDKRAKQCLFKLSSGTWLGVFTTFLWRFNPGGSTWRSI